MASLSFYFNSFFAYSLIYSLIPSCLSRFDSAMSSSASLLSIIVNLLISSFVRPLGSVDFRSLIILTSSLVFFSSLFSLPGLWVFYLSVRFNKGLSVAKPSRLPPEMTFGFSLTAFKNLSSSVFSNSCSSKLKFALGNLKLCAF